MKAVFGRTWALWLLIAAVAAAGLAELYTGGESLAPLTVTFPDPTRPSSVLLVSGGEIAVIDPDPDDEEKLAAILRSRRIRRIDLLILTAPRAEVPAMFRERFPAREILRLAAGDTVPLGGAEIRIPGQPGESASVLHGACVIPLTPPAGNSHRGPILIRSTGKEIRVQPDGSRWN